MRRERLLMVISMLVASCFGGMAMHLFFESGVRAQGRPEVLTASQLNIVSDNGTLRGVLAGTDERGMASLTFYDDFGQVRSLVGLQPDGTPVIRLLDSNGQARLFAAVQGDDAVAVLGADTGPQVMVGSIQGSTLIRLGEQTENRLQLQVTPTGLPRVALSDQTGNEALSLSVASNAAPEVALSTEGQTRAIMTVAEGATLLNLYDSDQPRLVLGVAANGRPSVSFLNQNGEITDEVP